MQIKTFYFELGPPPTQLSNLAAADVWTWTLPFGNDSWKAGQAVFKHNGTLKVKMMWPATQDAATSCGFDADFKVGKRLKCSSPKADFQGYTSEYHLSTSSW